MATQIFSKILRQIFLPVCAHISAYLTTVRIPCWLYKCDLKLHQPLRIPINATLHLVDRVRGVSVERLASTTTPPHLGCCCWCCCTKDAFSNRLSTPTAACATDCRPLHRAKACRSAAGCQVQLGWLVITEARGAGATVCMHCRRGRHGLAHTTSHRTTPTHTRLIISR